MGLLRDIEGERRQFLKRVWVAGIAVLGGFFTLLARQIWLGVVQHKDLSTQAKDNHIALAPLVPNRGLILDRNGVELATNISAYTLEISPAKLQVKLEIVIRELGEIVEIRPGDVRLFQRLREEAKNLESIPIRNLLSDAEVARFAAQRYRFPGVEIKARLFRHYPFGEVASHALGYVSRISSDDLDAISDAGKEDNYRGTLNIGKMGVEQSYEDELHGQTGYEEVEVSASGRPVRRLRSTSATPGNTLVLSLDIHLQQMVEQLYGNRRGALVALNPVSGEVLAFVSKPGFDPNRFVGGIDAELWRELNDSADRPLLNRVINGTYPPGSTYKPFMGLAALHTGKRTPTQSIYDRGFFDYAGHVFRDDKPGGHGPAVDMTQAIAQSCDTYFYMLANDMGVDLIHDTLAPFGFGAPTGVDLRGESSGVLPSTAWKRRRFKNKEAQRWYGGETVSLGIGQGYNAFTIMQLGVAVAALANRGQRMAPRLVREVRNINTGLARPLSSQVAQAMALRGEHLDVVRDAMIKAALPGGTAGLAFAKAPYSAAVKTGTAQVYSLKGEKYSHHKVHERLRDHALFIAFAPAEAPKVALAMVVENAGFGAQWAAPIARRVFDHQLLGLLPTAAEIAAIQGVKLEDLPAAANVPPDVSDEAAVPDDREVTP